MNLLFIISGSIAVIKCKKILENLTNKNIHIDCVITKSATKIIKSKTLQKVIKGKIYNDKSEKNNKMLHIKLTRKADLIVVCPATANLIAKFSHGYANDLASTCLVASDKQIIFMPAMNAEMWNNKINKNNVEKLQQSGVEFIGPEYGYLSCGEVGIGRLANEKKIAKNITEYLKRTNKLLNKHCLVTSGPTIEPIDPIRFISNYSSGKQGYEIAKQLVLSGAKVTLVSGPTNIQAPTNTKIIKVKTSKEMYNAVLKNLPKDIAIFTSAVTDISPTKKNNNKIPKNRINNISVKKNIDIIRSVAIKKKIKPKYIVGFAAETNNHILNAKNKLKNKKCDLIVLNKITKKNNVFGSDYNQIEIIDKNKIKKYKKMTKIDVAKTIINRVAEEFKIINSRNKK